MKPEHCAPERTTQYLHQYTKRPGSMSNMLMTMTPGHLTLRRRFAHIKVSYHLLRRFDGFERIFHNNPELYNLRSLEELAEVLWEV